PLLVDGSSQRYLHNPCVGAWTRTPPLSPGAFARFFPGDFGPWACPCNATSTGNPISGLQSFLNVQAPTLARPPGCTHRSGSVSSWQTGRLHHVMDERFPARTVASLHV